VKSTTKITIPNLNISCQYTNSVMKPEVRILIFPVHILIHENKRPILTILREIFHDKADASCHFPLKFKKQATDIRPNTNHKYVKLLMNKSPIHFTVHAADLSYLQAICISPNSTWLVKSRLDTTRHVQCVERVQTSKSRRACRAVLFQHGGLRTSYSTRLYKFSSLMLFLTQILLAPSNEINYINVYFSKLVNNLHIITSYKLYNKLSCESCLSRSSCRACRAVQFDKLDTIKNHGLDMLNVSCLEPLAAAVDFISHKPPYNFISRAVRSVRRR